MATDDDVGTSNYNSTDSIVLPRSKKSTPDYREKITDEEGQLELFGVVFLEQLEMHGVIAL